MRRQRVVGLLLLVGVLALAAGAAYARPGGGQSYSGGSSSSGGGGGGGGGGWGGGSSSSSSGDAGDVLLLIELIFRYPQIGLPLTAIIIFIYVMKARASSRTSSNWDYGQFHEAPAPVPRGEDRKLDQLRADDPDFSVVLLEDFVYALYARAYAARHDRARLAELAPYLSDSAAIELARGAAAGRRVTAVVIGAMSVVRVRRTPVATDALPAGDWVRYAFESNLVIEGADGRRATQYLTDEWVFRRNLGVQTRPWKGARSFDCPNCGAPATQWTQQKCGHCDQPLEGGRFDWMVHTIETRNVEDRAPSLTGTTPERGTDSPTSFAPDVQSEWAALLADDPALSVEALGARLLLIYQQLNDGWNAQSAAQIRPWVSDGLFAYMQYWLDAYASQGLKNYLQEARFTNWTIAKVTRDKHYTAVTLRIYATGLDYTVRGDELVGGSSSRPRAYSEYWTLIRSAAVHGAPRLDRACPNCGAELKVGMGGNCEFCNVTITRGDFDWVLSKIEQDESYRG